MNYYNEYDQKIAAWLRGLIAAGLIPDGYVDTRSIVDVQPSDLAGFTQCHFFCGIAGWPLALQFAGWPIDRPVWTGSCPCQPFSVAGKGGGINDERHLWPEFLRLIKACRPAVVFGEQVASADVIGRRATENQVREMLDRKAIVRVLRQWPQGEREEEAEMHRVQKQRPESGADQKLRNGPGDETRDDFSGRGEMPGEGIQSSVRSGSGGHSTEDRVRILRANRYSVRPVQTEGVELSVSGPNHTGSGIHESQCEGGALFGERDESQLGAEFDPEDCGFHQGSAAEEIERIIGEIGCEIEADNPVWLDGIQHDLEAVDYTFGAVVMAASSVQAPHIRQRLYWVADSARNGCESWKRGRGKIASAQDGGGLVHSDITGFIPRGETSPTSGYGDPSDSADFWSDCRLIQCRDGKLRRIPTEPAFFPLADGIPYRVGKRGSVRPALLHGAGNAIVPQTAEVFIRAFMDTQS